MATADNVKKKIQYIISECNKISGSDQKTLGMAVLAAILAFDPLDIQITENGTYNPSDYGANCIGTVQVEVPDRYQEGYDTGLSEGSANADVRYQEGYDMGHSEGYTEATANLPPERSDADITITDNEFGEFTVNIPQGIYPDIEKLSGVSFPCPYGWVCNVGDTITKLYFNTRWANDFFNPPRTMDEVLSSISYADRTFNGLRYGEFNLFVGRTEDGSYMGCSLVDLTAIQPGLYVIGTGNIPALKVTFVYATQDFDFTAMGLPLAAKAGWNTAEVDFPCTITSSGYGGNSEALYLVSKVPVRFGN